ncbi:MAG: hypothetical protein RBR77_11390, partial [Thauera sp.]|nr:hypothetical protein [Thauera sp.]
EAVRLEKAAKETTGAERRENLEQAADERAKAASAIASLDDNPLPEHAAADTPEPSKIRVKKDFVQDVVTRICGYESPDGKSIDRWSMPGGADDLLWLMGKLYPDEFADMSIKAFRAHYRMICRWPTTASSQAGARPIYLEIFPELKRNPVPVIQIRN